LNVDLSVVITSAHEELERNISRQYLEIKMKDYDHTYPYGELNVIMSCKPPKKKTRISAGTEVTTTGSTNIVSTIHTDNII
jgi:hypothetical protein